MLKEKEKGLEKFSQKVNNGKVYVFKKKFKMNRLLMNNENEKNEWLGKSIGQDYFRKLNNKTDSKICSNFF